MNEQNKVFYLEFTGRFTIQTILEHLPFLAEKRLCFRVSSSSSTFVTGNIDHCRQGHSSVSYMT